MIQSVFFLLLGFLSATLLALMIAPAVWRRAVALTKKRIEASVPLSTNELRAEKDQVRADSAVSIRRLEIKIKSLNEVSVEQKKELSNRLEEIRQLNEENDGRAETIEGLESDIAKLNKDLDGLQLENTSLSTELTSACDQIETKISELEHLSRLYDEVSLVSSNRQIDLVARETQIEKLNSEIESLKQTRDEKETQLREMSAELKVTERGVQIRGQEGDWAGKEARQAFGFAQRCRRQSGQTREGKCPLEGEDQTG